MIIIFCIPQNLYAKDRQKKGYGSVILKADLIKYDDNLNALAANGNVYVSMDNYILKADNLYYDIEKDVLFAKGNIKIKDKEGKIITGQRAILKDKLKKGVIDEFILKLPDDSLLMAAYANRYDENRVGLHKASFTPCKIVCGNKPIWQIRSEETNIDYEKERITYKNMFFEVFGLPVIYLPYFFHPTPTASAKSGILIPRITKNKFVLPLYFRAKSNLDLTLSPHISKNHTIFAGELRHLIEQGSYEINGSYSNHPYYKEQKLLKSYRYTIFAKGSFHKNGINYGFNINRASDKAYLVNDFENYDSYLESKLYANKVDKANYISLDAYSFQGFRTEDKKSNTPLVLPRVKAQKIITLDDDETIFLKAKNNAVIYSEHYETQLTRNALELTLNKKIITPNGHLFDFAIANRNDLYLLNSNNFSNKTEQEKIFSRNIPEFHAKWRYPLIGTFLGATSVKIEPIAAAFIGQNYNKNSEKFAIIDTNKYELSEYNLFNANKFSGIDYHDYGKRFSYGLNTSLLSGSYYFDIFLGQLVYYNNIAAKDNKDYVGNLSTDIADNLKLYYRFRKNKKLTQIKDEVGMLTNIDKVTANLNFSKLSNISRYYPDNVINLSANKVSQLGAYIAYQIFESLTLSTGVLFDTTKKTRLLQRTIQVTYVIDCVSITGKFYDDFTNDKNRGVKKNSSKTFAIGLKVLNM